MREPEFTLIVPSFNHEPFVEQAIQSALGQTEPFDRIVFFSDGSTDKTLEIAESLLKDNPRVIWLPDLRINKGLVPRLRESAERLSEGYVMILSADDILMPDACETFHRLARSHPFEWAIGAVEVTDRELHRIGLVDPLSLGCTMDGDDLFERLLRLDPWLPTQGWCYSADLLRRVGGFDPRCRVEDYSQALRFARATRPVLTSTLISRWRRNTSSLSHVYSEEMWVDHAQTAMRFLFDSPLAVLSTASGHFEEACAKALGKKRWLPAAFYCAASLSLWPTPGTVLSWVKRAFTVAQRKFMSTSEHPKG